MEDKIECVDTIEKFFHLVNDEVEKHNYSVDEVLWIWASGQVAFEGDSKVTMRTLKEEVRRTASTNTQSTPCCESCGSSVDVISICAKCQHISDM